MRSAPSSRFAFFIFSFSFFVAVPLCNQLFHNLSIANDIDRAVAWAHQLLFAIDAELVIQSHREVLDAQWFVGRFRADRVGRAVDQPLLDPTTGKNNAEDL